MKSQKEVVGMENGRYILENMEDLAEIIQEIMKDEDIESIESVRKKIYDVSESMIHTLYADEEDEYPEHYEDGPLPVRGGWVAEKDGVCCAYEDGWWVSTSRRKYEYTELVVESDGEKWKFYAEVSQPCESRYGTCDGEYTEGLVVVKKNGKTVYRVDVEEE